MAEIDREKVIKGLELCKQDTNLCFLETECPYQCEYPICCLKLMADALELLKEQEAVVRCKDCKYILSLSHVRQCCRNMSHWQEVDDDWFCAGGERKE